MAEGQTQNLESSRGRQRIVKGVVISDKMNKTRLIVLARSVRHSLYHKSLERQRRLFVHDEKNESKEGDTVLAAETRRLSRNKSFKLVKVVEKKAGT